MILYYNYVYYIVSTCPLSQAAKQNLDGSISLDFKSPTSLRALCKVLLKSDFGLAIDLPADRLVPAIPQRLNYLLWIEDILNANAVQVPVCGIDVGKALRLSECLYDPGNTITYPATEWQDLLASVLSYHLRLWGVVYIRPTWSQDQRMEVRRH